MPSNKTVLLVDDDQEIVLGAQLRLRAAGYSTVTAEDGNQCLAAVAAARPDVIVLDVRMPIKDGLAALNELQSDAATCSIPVVMLSASIVDQQSALEAGARFFLSKPYQGKKLVAAVAAAINEAPDCETETINSSGG